MRQMAFEAQHRAEWQAFEAALERLEKKAQQTAAKDLRRFSRQYSLICHHLALSQDRHYSGGLSDYLQQLAERGHKQLYRYQGGGLWRRFADFVTRDFPRTVRAQKNVVLWAHALFYVPLLAALLLVALHPPLLEQMAGADVGGQAAESYADMAAQYADRENRPAAQDWMMFGFYIFNNISIAFQSFVGGLLFGIGTVYVTVFNGLIIGGVMGYMLHQPSGWAFYSFILAHGAFELTGIVLAAAGGLRLGLALLMPQGLSRREALKMQGKTAATLMSGAFLLLAVAAVVEGYWSPITALPMALKFAVGIAMWLAVYAYLWRAGRT